MQRCLFFHFPYSGGEYSEVTDTIGKHYVTPVTIGPICSDRCEGLFTLEKNAIKLKADSFRYSNGL